MKYVIVSDGGCDLDIKFIKANNIKIVSCYISLDGKEYLKNYVDINAEEFYNLIKDDTVFPKTSLPSVYDYFEEFCDLTEKEYSILCLCMTSNLSGSYQSALTARDMIIDKYKCSNIQIIDTRVNTVLQGMIIQECVKLKKAGIEMEQVIQHINCIKNTAKIYFAIGNMKLLSKGGRTKNLSNIMNATIGIKPILTIRDGEHHIVGITRSRKKSISKILETVVSNFQKSKENPNDYNWVVGYGEQIEEAVILREQLIESLNITVPVNMQQIGIVIAAHTGPHPIGIAYIKRLDVLGGEYE